MAPTVPSREAPRCSLRLWQSDPRTRRGPPAHSLQRRAEAAVPDDLAASNVNRAYSLAATSLAIFTFMLIFLFPRLASGEANPTLFQATVVLMGVATFSFVLAAFHYYGVSL